MSYTKQTFIDNETVLTAAYLEHMEDGISANSDTLDGLVNNDADATDGAYFPILVKRNGSIVPIWEKAEGSYYIYDGNGAVSPRNVYKRTTLYAQANLQDGAIYDGKSFTGNSSGTIYIKDVVTGGAVQTMALDKKDTLTPHSNTVCISTRDGELHLYSNIYSNYKSEDDKHIGECCVYSLAEADGTWSNSLAQVIKIGFINNTTYWPPSTESRPYGNFVVDDENDLLYVYVLRSGTSVTQWYKFDLPAVTAGTTNDTYGCPVCTLTTDDILDSWTTVYADYIQGGCVHNGMIWSISGADGQWGAARCRVVSPDTKAVVATFNFVTDDNAVEPEFIDFDGDTCYYGDIQTMYRLDLF